MPKAQKILRELNSIGTFMRRVDASATSPASAGIPTVAGKHGFTQGHRDTDFAILANADGRSIVFGRRDGSWMLRDGQRTFVGQGSDQLLFQLRNQPAE
jgi:hypothetical protein